MGVQSWQSVLGHSRMALGVTMFVVLALVGFFGNVDAASNKTEPHTRDGKALSVFNVVTFPNSASGASLTLPVEAAPRRTTPTPSSPPTPPALTQTPAHTLSANRTQMSAN